MSDINIKCPSLYQMTQSDTVGRLFQMSADKGLDSYDFAEKVMTSDYGHMVMMDKRPHEYCWYTFMFEGFENNVAFKKGNADTVLDSEFLWFAGYLYKFWINMCQTDSREVYRLCTLRNLESRYDFYHTQGWYYVIEDILDKPFK